MNCGKRWGDVRLNNAIIAQVLAIGQNHQDRKLLKWVVEMLSQIREPEAWIVTGKRAFQATGLLFMENWHWVVQNSQKLDDLVESMSELRELRHTIMVQEQTILSLTDHIVRLERRSRRDRRGSGSSLS